jgi:DNA-binding NtrC family response regulator
LPAPIMGNNCSKEWEGPLFVLADDDHASADRITSLLYPGLFFIVSVVNPRHVLSYAKRLKPRAIFLADPLEFPKGGAAALLHRIIEEVGCPVIILTELWTPEVIDRWKQMGAADCLPHPTRFDQRLEVVRARMQELALTAAPQASTSGSGRGEG